MKKIITAFAGLIVVLSILAFTSGQENKSYSYLRLHQLGDMVVTSGTGFDFLEENIKNEKQDKLRDMSPVLLRIKEYEGKGFELVDVDMTGQTMIVLMRKEI